MNLSRDEAINGPIFSGPSGPANKKTCPFQLWTHTTRACIAISAIPLTALADHWHLTRIKSDTRTTRQINIFRESIALALKCPSWLNQSPDCSGER